MVQTKYLALLLLLAFTVGSCSEGHKGSKEKKGVLVRTFKVTSEKRSASNKFIGVVEEEFSASVSFPVQGTIDKVFFTEGQKVKKGDVLAELNSYSLVNAHTAALATLKQADDAMKRMKLLYENNSLAEIKYVEVKTNLEKAKSSEAIARKNMEDGYLLAPFNGIVGKRTAELGENVLPNESVFSLLQIDKVKVKIAVPEKEISSFRIGQTGMIKLTALNNKIYKGEITEKGVVADPVSHTYNVKMLIENKESELLPGMVGDVYIGSDNIKNVVCISAVSVQVDSKGKKFVWKVVEGRAVKTYIKIGNVLDKGIEVIDGLSIGDEIINGGYQKVVDGIKVKAL